MTRMSKLRILCGPAVASTAMPVATGATGIYRSK